MSAGPDDGRLFSYTAEKIQTAQGVLVDTQRTVAKDTLSTGPDNGGDTTATRDSKVC